MKTIQISSNSLSLNKDGGNLSLNGFSNTAQTTLHISGNLAFQKNDTCYGNVSTPIFTQNTYTFTGNRLEIPFETKTGCSRAYGFAVFSIVNKILTFSISYNVTGVFTEGNFTGSSTLNSVTQEIEEYNLSYDGKPAGVDVYQIKRTYNIEQPNQPAEILVSNPSYSGVVSVNQGDELQIIATASTGYNPPIAKFASTNSQTITVNGPIYAQVQSGGKISFPLTKNIAAGTNLTMYTESIPAHPPEWCDEGCYCYCNGEQYDHGTEMCPPVYILHPSNDEVYLYETMKFVSSSGSSTLANTIINDTIYGSTTNYLTVTGAVTVSTNAVTSSTRTIYENIAEGSYVSITNQKGQKVTAGKTINLGDVLTISAHSNLGYELGSLNINGTTYLPSGSRQITVSGDVTITTTCKAKYNLSINAGSSSSITVIRNGETLNSNSIIYEGDSLTITATPQTGYAIKYLIINNSKYTSNTKTIVVNSDVSISTDSRRICNINKNLATGTSVTILRELIAPSEPDYCDGGCYCYCGNEQIADGEMCPGSYETITSSSVVLYGDTLLITPVISNGYTMESFIINGTEYLNTSTRTITVYSDLNIQIKTVAPTWKTVATYVSLSGNGTGSVTKTVSGLVPGKKTRYTISSGNYSATVLTGYEPATDCDGGCYCYCGDMQIEDGGSCPVYTTYTTNINTNGYQTTENGTLTLSLNGSHAVTNGTLTIPSSNTLSFNGYLTGYSSGQSKQITITKIEQQN